MKDIRKDGPQDKQQGQQQPSAPSEIQGFIELGMKKDALRLARRTLKSSALTAEAFNNALDAILTLVDKLQPWTQLVESAYERLAKRDRPAARFYAMAFRAHRNDHERVLQLMPKRIKGQVTFLELPYLVDAALALDKKDLAKRLAKHLPQAAHEANDGIMQSRLLYCWAEFLARSGNWDEAIRYWEVVQLNETLSRGAVISIVELHAARALLAVRQGFRLSEHFNRGYDPVTETILPGNDTAVQDKAAKEFRRLQKLLEKIVPEKLQKELGIDSAKP